MNRFCIGVKYLCLLVFSCGVQVGCGLIGGGDTPAPDLTDSPTPFPVMDIRETTWDASFSTGIDPLVQGHTIFYMNTVTVENGEVFGWFWHAYGELYIDGVEIPPMEAVDMYGTFDGVELFMEGRLHGHVLTTEGHIETKPSTYYAFLNLDDGLYIRETWFYPGDYWHVTPY